MSVLYKWRQKVRFTRENLLALPKYKAFEVLWKCWKGLGIWFVYILCLLKPRKTQDSLGNRMNFSILVFSLEQLKYDEGDQDSNQDWTPGNTSFPSVRQRKVLKPSFLTVWNFKFCRLGKKKKKYLLLRKSHKWNKQYKWVYGRGINSKGPATEEQEESCITSDSPNQDNVTGSRIKDLITRWHCCIATIII